MATTVTDRLFVEVDRQLVEVRTLADGIATRAGVLVSATALAAGLLASRLATIGSGALAVCALVALGTATLLGIFVFAPGLVAGPRPTSLASWAAGGAGSSSASSRPINLLYAAKLEVLEANLHRLAVMRTIFYLQGLATVIAVGLALVVAGVRPA